MCAIQVASQNISQLNARLIFKYNSAKYAGNSIYIAPLYECQQLFLKDSNNTDLYNELFYFDGNNDIGEVSLAAVSTRQCSMKNVSQIEVYPGETITIGLRAYDLNDNPTFFSAQILTTLTKSESKCRHHEMMTTFDITNQLQVKQQIQTVYSNNCTTLNFTILPENTKDTMLYILQY